MSKKMMMLALAVVSAAFLALPALASAQEIHLEPGEAFTISGPGCEIRASGEPTITCTSITGTGNFDAGSTTTGSLALDLTGCHTAVFGFTASCKSEGAATSGTVATGGTFHLITNSSGVPGVLITLNPTIITAAGINPLTLFGNLIGTITSPVCGGSSKSVGYSFTATGSTQNHLTYTGSNYDLRVKTGSGEERTAAFVANYTATASNAAKLNCT